MVLSHITSLPSLPFLECLVSSNQSHLGKSCRFHQFEHFFFQRSPSLTFFCRILCMIGSQVISSILSLALMFMGFLGISDLRNPDQWYCSDGDKNRMIHWITKTSHSKNCPFLQSRKSCCIICTFCPARYCGICAHLRYSDIYLVVMLHCILCNEIVSRHCL